MALQTTSLQTAKSAGPNEPETVIRTRSGHTEHRRQQQDSSCDNTLVEEADMCDTLFRPFDSRELGGHSLCKHGQVVWRGLLQYPRQQRLLS